MSPFMALIMLGVVEAAIVGYALYSTARRVLGLGPGRSVFA